MKYENLSPNEELYIKAKEAYYKGKPIMTDLEFDELEETLKNDDSFVVDIVGSKSKNKLSVEHTWPMLSLSKIKFKKDYIPYSEFCSFHGNIDDILEFTPKLDGNAITCKYENDKLVSISSRGDGKFGQDYTNKLKNKIPNIIKNFSGEIRGEAVIDLNLFNEKYLTGKYKNARNFVAGTLNTDYDKKLIDQYNDIDFIAFDIKGLEVDDSKKWLISKGFETLDYRILERTKNITNNLFIDIYNKFSEYRKTCKYQLDGIVAKFINNDIISDLGSNNHHPLYALAIKFISEEVYTDIIDIEWNMTKTGKLAPVAILKPVELMGSTVQRASVYNASWMIKNKCYPGATVVLVKSGDIIPRIVDVSVPSERKYELIKEYKSYKLTYDGINLNVDGFEDTEEYKSIKLYNSIVALGFKNIGPATCEHLNNAGLELKDILSSTPDSLRMNLINSGEFKDGRELELLIENIFELKEVELWQIIYSFGWKNCGQTISKQLANYKTGIEYDFKGLEKAVIESYINSKERQNDVDELISILQNNNITVKNPVSTSGSISYEMTGSPESHGFGTKENFAYQAHLLGAVKTSLKAGTMFLVTDSLASNSGKMQKAKKLGAQIMEYGQFLEYLKNK